MKVARADDKGRRWYLESDEPDTTGRWDKTQESGSAPLAYS